MVSDGYNPDAVLTAFAAIALDRIAKRKVYGGGHSDSQRLSKRVIVVLSSPTVVDKRFLSLVGLFRNSEQNEKQPVRQGERHRNHRLVNSWNQRIRALSGLLKDQATDVAEQE